MLKIEISTIRKFASDLITLNDGYLLYQQGKVKNASMLHDATKGYDYIIKGDVLDLSNIILSVSKDECAGSCGCKNKLCKHEVALFFVLRDMVNKMMSNEEEIKLYESTFNVNNLFSNVYKSLTKNSEDKLDILPTINLASDPSLFLDVLVENTRYKIKNIEEFLSSVLKNDNYFLNNKYLNVGFSSLSESSQTLINLIRNAKITSINSVELYYPLIDDLYKLYSKEIYVFNGYYSKAYTFNTKKFPLCIKATDKGLVIDDLSYKIIKGSENIYIFYKEEIYVSSNKVLGIILDYLKDNEYLTFTKDSYNTFLINIYPYIKDYITGIDYYYQSNIDTTLDFTVGALSLTYQSDIDESVMFIKRDNYLKFIESLGFNKSNDYKIRSINDICYILENKLDIFKKYGNLYMTSNVSNIKIKPMPNISFSLHLDGGIFSIVNNIDKDTFASIKLAYKNNEKYIINKANEILKLDYDNISDVINLIDELSFDSDKKNIKLYQAYYLNYKYKKYLVTDEAVDSFFDSLSNYNNIDIPQSSYLRDYQKSGVKWLYTLSKFKLGGVLADDMGLGKTLEIISLLEIIKPDKPVIIITPSSLIFNWAEEFNKYAKTLDFVVMYGEARDKDNVAVSLKKNKIIIISYETLRIDLDLYKDYDFSFEICDEAQFIKNPSALKTIATKSIKADVKFALTGTPIENGLLDLWSIFDFVLPGYLEGKQQFISKYDGYAKSSSILENLNKRISPFMLRRLKTDVLDLEDKIESTVYSKMSLEEKNVYNNFLSDIKENIRKNDKMVNVLASLTRLREIACEPRLFLDNINNKNSKMDMLFEIIDEKILGNHKILLFSQFTSLFPYFKERLESKKIPYLELSGSTKSIDRIMLVDKFNKDESIKVFLISLKAGGTGLNLTSADTVIHYDPWWNNAAMNQATDRAYRIGQTKVVHVIKMINEGTIEDKILELCKKKKELFDNVISDDEVIKVISSEELKELFK